MIKIFVEEKVSLGIQSVGRLNHLCAFISTYALLHIYIFVLRADPVSISKSWGVVKLSQPHLGIGSEVLLKLLTASAHYDLLCHNGTRYDQ